MTARAMIEAWVLLVVLSASTTALTFIEMSGRSRMIIAAGVLVLAGLKARIILTRYLQLRNSRFWTRAFDLAIGGFLLLSFGLYASATGP
jgi:cytochrome c oxidase subunit IV